MRKYTPVSPIPFRRLLLRITNHYGGSYRACKHIGISVGSYHKLINESLVSAFVGSKILAHYRFLVGA